MMVAGTGLNLNDGNMSASYIYTLKKMIRGCL